jgi:hypothetical protein
MKIITAPIQKALDNTPLYSKDGQGKDAKVILKLFGGGRFTYLVTEAQKNGDDYTVFGYCVSPLGPECDEFGYASLNELLSLKFQPFGLGIERDRSVVPNRYTVGDLI